MTEHACPIHNVPLTEDDAPILYGTFRAEKAEVIEQRLKAYPYANTLVRGPCWVEGETHAKVTFCPVCRATWLATPEGRQETEYLAKNRLSEEMEIEELLAQQSNQERMAIIYCSFGAALFFVSGSALGIVIGYAANYGLVLSAVVGGLMGVLVHMLRFALANPAVNRTCAKSRAVRLP